MMGMSQFDGAADRGDDDINDQDTEEVRNN